jgi:hypothetical protein
MWYIFTMTFDSPWTESFTNTKTPPPAKGGGEIKVSILDIRNNRRIVGLVVFNVARVVSRKVGD